MTSVSSLLGIFFLGLLTRISDGLPETIRVGGLFEPEFEGQKLAFTNAIEKINLRSDILPKTLLIYDVQEVQYQDSFHASKKVCKQLKEGVGAIFGPLSRLSAAHVQSICNAMEIPHLETKWDPRDNKDFYSINLYPHYVQLSKAYTDLIKYWKWTEFTILYEDNDGLIRLQEILKSAEENNFKITVRKLESVDGSYIALLKEIRARNEFRIVVDSSVRTAQHVLKQAQEASVMSEYYHYFFTTLDLGMLYLDGFMHNGANITAMRMVDPMNPQVMSVRSDWAIEETRTGTSPLMGEREIQTETALIYDAVQLFAKALHELAQAQDINTTPLSCSRTQTWNHGNSLLNYMKLMDFNGLSGRVHYDEKGLRSSFDLDVIELTPNGLIKTGSWSTVIGINITKGFIKRKQEIAETLANSTLRVTTVLEKPYTMEKTPGVPIYEGFAIDLLDEIAKDLKFKYKIHIVADGKFGAADENGDWNGMVRELMDQKADLALAGMSITYRREKVIDFTKPFLNLGITILFKKPEKTPPKLFSFLSPLSIEVWVYVIAAYLCVSFTLFVLARFSPYEWYNPHPCNPDSDVVENQFSILNSLWFTIGSLMQQGCEIAPRAVSTRLVSGIWWFFTLILISSYTANLAAFLTVERMISPIESADELAKQTEIKYGTLFGGSTMAFFKTSEFPSYARMWRFMINTEPSVFVNSTEEAIERVRKGHYAYLGESTTIDYNVQRKCDLMQIGQNLDSKGYGIATPRGSVYRDLISESILKLQESQMIHKLYTKWWKEVDGGGKCEVEDDGKKDASELGVSNVGGVFVVLMAGMAAGLVVAFLEFVWKARKNANEDKQSLCSEMAEELRFAMRCSGGSTKSVKKRENKEPVMDNGLHLMPLTGLISGHHLNGKEAYA